MPAGPLLAGVVEQPLRHVLPERVGAIQADGIGRLYFHGPLAAAAGDAQHVAVDFRKTSLSGLGHGRAGARVFEDRFPIFGRERGVRTRTGWRPSTVGFSGQFFHLLRGRHAPARGSVGHARIRT